MVIPECFIVTVTSALEDVRADMEGTIGPNWRAWGGANFEVDLEIPSQIPFAEMKGKLLEILKILDKRFHSWRDCALQFESHVLAESEAIADIGAFDGSRLVVLEV